MRNRLQRLRLIERLATLGAVEAGAEDERLRRSALVLTPLWIVTLLALGLPIPASIPLGYLVVTIPALAWFARTRRYAPFRTLQLALMLFLPFALQWSLGGFAASSAVSFWGLWA